MTSQITIARETFVATGEENKNNSIPGTVELTIFGETRTVEATLSTKYDWIFARGIEGCYRTGTKWWGGTVQSTSDGKINVQFGRYDNHPKFSKTNIRFKD